MVTFRSNNNNNNRRPPYRSNNNRRPPYRGNNEGSKFSSNDNFQRKVPGRNNHNALKLIEKYNEMAREALANEDRVLSENYFQHADHFTRVQNEQESIRMARISSSPVQSINPIKTEVNEEKDLDKAVETQEVKKIIPEPVVKKVVKTIEKKQVEKKATAI
tara:strand:+ start:126 stop:608 length:483 start_codon:yes stop_codon:yes gene_type:complete